MKRIKKIVNTIIKPVERDRWLFGGNGWGMIIFSVVIAFAAPLAIWLGTIVVDTVCTNDDLKPEVVLLSNYDTDVKSLSGVITGDSITLTTSDSANKHKAWWAILSQYTDPGNLPAAETSGYGYLLALFCAIAGIFCLSGFAVSSLVSFISRVTERWKQGLLQYDRMFSKYIVIIGVNEQAPSIIKRALAERGAKYVLIQTRKDVEKTRMALELKLEDSLESRVVFYSGERTSAEDIAKLRLDKAMEIYILGEEISYDNEKDHDAFNVECLEHVALYLKDNVKKRKKYFKGDNKVRVHVNFEYQSTFTAFKATHLYHKLGRDVEFIPFNVHEIWAKKVLVDNFAIIPAGKKNEHTVQYYHPIDTYIENGKRLGITADCKKTVHLIVLGMNQMGTALATQAALLCHFPNFSNDIRKKTTITFIDDHAKEEGEYLRGRFSTLFELCKHRTIICKKNTLNDQKGYDVDFIDNVKKDKNLNHLLKLKSETNDSNEETDSKESFIDLQWEFIQGNVASKDVQDYITAIAKDETKTTTIAICFNHPQQSIASAMYLPSEVYSHANQVLVYQQNSFDVVNDVANGDVEWKRYPNLFPFGMIESSYTENQFENPLAKLEHYIYLKGKDKDGNKVPIVMDKNLLKYVDAQWDQLGIVQKLANIDMVESIPMKLRSMGMLRRYESDKIEEIGQTKEMIYAEHMRWMVERLIMGFRYVDETEQGELTKDDLEPTVKTKKKNELKDKERAHLDICSNLQLLEVDNQMHNNDKVALISLVDLFQCAEWIGILRLSDSRYENSQHKRILSNFMLKNNNLLFSYIKGIGKDSKRKLRKTRHSYWISKIEVTNAQWETITGQKKYKSSKEKNLPVVNISKKEIDDFIVILRKKTGIYFSIPSIKEWVYAAEMKADKRIHHHVDSKKLKSVFSDKSELHHMLGNVWEWTSSELKQGKSKEVVENCYYFCGGSWRFTERECNLEDNGAYWKNSGDENRKSDDLGFRLMWNFELEGDNNSDNLEAAVLPNKNLIVEKKEQNLKVLDWFKQDKHRMIRIQKGMFIMGANQTDDSSVDSNETPRHAVNISHDFYMCRIPVTQSLWNAVMKINASENPTTNRTGDEIPQTNVSWKDIMRLSSRKKRGFLCELNKILKDQKSGLLDYLLSSLSEKEREKIKKGSYEFRLPTEAEWEYAAKGGNNTNIDSKRLVEKGYLDTIPQERKYSVNVDNLESTDNKNIQYGNTIIPNAGDKEEGALGLCDMSGTVWEWCMDHYIFDMYDICKDGYRIKNEEKEYIEAKDIQLDVDNRDYLDSGYITDPVASDNSYKAHVFRGGSWKSKTAWDCRCTRANFWIDSHRADDLGFRLVFGCPINSIKHQ